MNFNEWWDKEYWRRVYNTKDNNFIKHCLKIAQEKQQIYRNKNGKM